MSSHTPITRNSILSFQSYKSKGEKFTMITAYDAMMANLFDENEIPFILVGDSAGNNFLGYENTIPVTLDQMVIFTASVVRGTSKALIIADLPFGSYQTTPEQALDSAIRLVKEGGAQAVKLEGGKSILPQIEKIIAAGIPVVGHIGLTPQSVNAIGGYKVQGRGETGELLLQEAIALADAGVSAIVLEMVPAELAKKITDSISIPTVGIGAGNQTSGQVLVWTDLLGLTPKAPRFARKYLNLRDQISAGLQSWKSDTANGEFPNESESF